MIVRYEKVIPMYEKFGVFTEARKRKGRTISVRPVTRSYTNEVEPSEDYDVDTQDDDNDEADNYTADIDTPDETTDDGEDTIDVDDAGGTDDAGSSDNTSGDTEDYTSGSDTDSGGEEDTSGDSGSGGGTEPEGDGAGGNSGEGETGGDDVDTGTSGTTIDADDAGTDEDEGDAASGEDYTSGAEGNTSEDETSTDTGTDGSTTGADDGKYTKDDMRKFRLFNQYIELYRTVLYFVEKLDICVMDNLPFQKAVKKAGKVFSDIGDMLKDYMLLKFQSDNFLQNSFFYEKIKASCMLALELLNVNKIQKDDNKQ